MSETDFNVRFNPRFPDKRFSLSINLPCGRVIGGNAFLPSCYGATVQINQGDYLHLEKNGELLLGVESAVEVTTHLNIIPATINSIRREGEKCLVSLKLAENRTWFN